MCDVHVHSLFLVATKRVASLGMQDEALTQRYTWSCVFQPFHPRDVIRGHSDRYISYGLVLGLGLGLVLLE